MGRRYRWGGIATLVFALFVLFCGWAVWSEMGEEAASLGDMQVVAADDLADVSDGTRVAVEGTTVAGNPPAQAPVSGDKVAWYVVRREHHWKELRESCSRHHVCHMYWANDHEQAPGESSGTLAVRITGSADTVVVTIPEDNPTAVARLTLHDTSKTPLDVRPMPGHKGDYLEHREYVLPLGKVVTLTGTVKRTGNTATIVPVRQNSLVYPKRRDAMITNLRSYRTVGEWMMVIGVLIGLGGVALLRRGRRARAATGATTGP